MPVIINEVEVIAPPPGREELRHASPETTKPVGPTPRDIYWAVRKLLERRLRLEAR